MRAKRSDLVLGVLLLLVLGLLLALAMSCGGPPGNPDDLCAIFDEKRSWYKAARRSRETWGVPEPVLLALIYQESSFQADVRPPRRRYLWIFPGPRPSSAYGYGQIIDETWESYRQARGGRGAERDDFADVADFIGWYGDLIRKETGISPEDAELLYLAYHEGPRGYLRGSHRSKPSVQATARAVRRRADRYAKQYEGCRKRLARRWF